MPEQPLQSKVQHMKTLEFRSNWANFDYLMTAEVGEDLTPATEMLCQQGMGNISYRVAGSAVDKALGVKTGKGEPGRKGVEYSEADGERINAAVSAKITELENGKDGVMFKALKLRFQVTGQHEYGGTDAPASKEAEKIWTGIQAVADPEKFKAALGRLGLDPEDYDDDRALAAIHTKLKAAKAAALAAAKAEFGV